MTYFEQMFYVLYRTLIKLYFVYVEPQTSTPLKQAANLTLTHTESPILSDKESGHNERVEMDIDCTIPSSSFHDR